MPRGRRDRDREVDPGRRRPGRGQRGRRRRARRPGRPVGHPGLARATSTGWPPSWAATCRSACSAGSRSGTGRGEQLSPVLARTPVALGARHRRRGAVHPRGLRGAGPAAGERHACPTAARSRPADPVIAALRERAGVGPGGRAHQRPAGARPGAAARAAAGRCARRPTPAPWRRW